MKILVQLSHPAHFHYYKVAIKNWLADGHKVFILIKTKDILEKLLQDAQLPFYNINVKTHRSNKFGILFDMLVRDWHIFRFCKKNQIDILTGSTPEVAQIGKVLHKPVVNIGEDDAAVVPNTVRFLRPFVQTRISPRVCDNGPMENKSIKVESYQELGYLHPNHFTPDKAVVEKYGIETDKPYFILRFASLKAHHDAGIQGINTEIAQHLIDQLLPHGRIYITSERELEPQFEQYRIKINPLDMHHVMAFASLYIGDSQTMAAEAGVLGTPFVRFNDFVGRIGYLRELEDVYQLGYGIHATPIEMKRVDGSLQPNGEEALYEAVDAILALPAEERRKTYQARRQKMLSEKIDYAKFLTWFIEQYPQSAKEAKEQKENTKFWEKFK